ncbi:MAG: hypothetical protein FWD16_05425 [Clostridia bacterium]|nr:hypothetical protein [Clostridia bacterium]
MSETVASIQTMPQILTRMIRAKTVKIREEGNGVITVIPIREDDDCPLFGFLGEGKMSTERFMADKQLEKELEL